MQLSPEKLVEWSRNKSPVDRFCLLAWLRCRCFNVPDFGVIEDLLGRHDSADWCITWLPGESVMMTLNDAYNKWPTNLAAMHVGQRGSVSVSTRYIQIGDRVFWIDYASTDDWRSTKGNSQSVLTRTVVNRYHPTIKLPMFAIDYVKSDKIYAINFDAAPGIRGTGIDEMISRKEVAELIKKASKL